METRIVNAQIVNEHSKKFGDIRIKKIIITKSGTTFIVVINPHIII